MRTVNVQKGTNYMTTQRMILPFGLFVCAFEGLEPPSLLDDEN